MSASLEDALGLDLSNPSQRLALELVEADAVLLRDLREARKRAGLTVEQVAEGMGVHSDTVLDLFERYHSDPPLSLLRRYAHAVGVMVRHEVADHERIDRQVGGPQA